MSELQDRDLIDFVLVSATSNLKAEAVRDLWDDLPSYFKDTPLRLIGLGEYFFEHDCDIALIRDELLELINNELQEKDRPEDALLEFQRQLGGEDDNNLLGN